MNQDPILDTKETFQQISGISPIYTYLRYRNLTLADKLDNSKLREHEFVNKTVRALRYCSKFTFAKMNESGEIAKSEHSKKCRSRYCAICSRSKATKLNSRFTKMLTRSELGIELQKQNWYFLTLTLKHNNEIRDGNYYKEFKEYLDKLTRSVIYKRAFGVPSKSNLYGEIRAIETTISNNGLHIHSHHLITTNKKAKTEKQIKDIITNKWKKLTGDSFIVDLQRVEPEGNNQGIAGAAREVMKYQIKGNNSFYLSNSNTDLFSKFVAETKGSNNITAMGIFRGKQLTANQAFWDLKSDGQPRKEYNSVIVDSTSKMKFTRDLKYFTKIKELTGADQKVNFQSFSTWSRDITNLDLLETTIRERPHAWDLKTKEFDRVYRREIEDYSKAIKNIDELEQVIDEIFQAEIPF